MSLKCSLVVLTPFFLVRVSTVYVREEGRVQARIKDAEDHATVRPRPKRSEAPCLKQIVSQGIL